MENSPVRKIPTRRCTGCGEHFPKNTLIRVLRTPDGEVVLDLTGKKSGRGAYICKKSECLTLAIKKKRIDTAFKMTVDSEIYSTLLKELNGIE